MKGSKGDECARTACPNTDAHWFNRSTGKWYCAPCALTLNDANKEDAERLYHGPLCVHPPVTLEALASNGALLEVGRKAIEDELVELRDARIAVIRGNGLVICEKDRTPSSIIRMGSEQALAIALASINRHFMKPEEE